MPLPHAWLGLERPWGPTRVSLREARSGWGTAGTPRVHRAKLLPCSREKSDALVEVPRQQGGVSANRGTELKEEPVLTDHGQHRS